MKYLKQFLAQHYKLQPLGELTTEEYYEVADGAIVGEEIIIDGFRPGIIVWYADYTRWLEEQYDNLLETYTKLNTSVKKKFFE